MTKTSADSVPLWFNSSSIWPVFRTISIPWLGGLVILFLVSIFQIHNIHTTHMREDEEIAYRSTQYDLMYAVRFQAERDVHAPLWFASFWLWQQFMGDSEFMGRVYSIFLSMATMALVYQVGRRWFGAPRFGLFAMAVLGVNAYFFIYSLEIRPYAMVMLAASVSMWCFWRWLKLKTWQAAMGYGLSLAVLLYIHYFLAFLIVAQVLYFYVFTRPTLTISVQSAVAGALMIVLFLPWLPVLIGQIQTLQRIEAETTRGLGIANTTEPTTVEGIVELVNVTTNGQPGLYALALLVGAVVFLRRGGSRTAPTPRNTGPQAADIQSLLWGIGVPVIALAINLFAAVYTQRYVTYLAVGLALAVGAGLVALGQFMSRLNRQDAQVAKRASVGVLLGFVAISLWALPSQLPQDRIPYRDLLRNLSAAAQPGDVIFFDHAETNDNLAEWQYRHYLSPELWETAVSSEEAALEARRVWYITANWFDEAVRATFTDLERSRPVQTVLEPSRCDRQWCYLIQLMEAPPWEQPAVFGDGMAFWGADVDSARREAIRTRLWWRVEQPPTVDYSMSLQLLDGSGQKVAQMDGPINHYGAEIVQTSQLEPGRIYIDHRAITPTSDLPAGAYTLALAVYQSWDGVRLMLPDGRDSLVLDAVSIQ